MGDFSTGKHRHGRLRRILQDRRGSTLPMMGAAFLLVLGSVGSGIDIGRIYLVRAQLQAGVDAAALAGARSFEAKGTGPDSRDGQVQTYFAENFPDDFLGAGTVVPAATFDVVKGVNVTRVNAAVDLPMTFMGVFGVAPQPIKVTAVAELQPRPLEVMVVLDDTGSMQSKLPDGRTRMSALKEAMHQFVNVLHQGAQTRKELALGMITYTVTTNVGKILERAKVPVQPIDGYTNLDTYLGGKTGIGENGLAWGGCVENDENDKQVVKDLSSNVKQFEAGAWDIGRKLPHEYDITKGVKPYLYPPSAETTTKDAAYGTTPMLPADYRPSHTQSNTSDSRRNNLYKLTTDPVIAQILANKDAWRTHFYNFYIGLNDPGSSKDDDVVVHKNGGFFNPNSETDWSIDYSRIPYINEATAWAVPNPNYGFPLPAGTTRNLKMPSPNWQCPDPGIAVEYGQSKSVYDDFIDNHNFALMPASGTLHHIGFIWGYRLLARSDLFKRTNPIPDQKPLRAIVFMTDGETQAGNYATWYGSYGRLAERRITSSMNETTFRNQVMYRFGKACEQAKADVDANGESNPIKVYIVSLLNPESVTERIFQGCAGSNYMKTTTTSQIIEGFRAIAVDLVQLHLTQ